MPPAYLAQKRTQPLPSKDGGVLHHRGGRHLYVGYASCSRRKVPTLAAGTKLILDQADVAAVSHQVHLALFYDARLAIKAMR